MRTGGLGLLLLVLVGFNWAQDSSFETRILLYKEQKTRGERIFGGTEIRKNQYPWLVLVRTNAGEVCGGSVVASTWILTAAHCVQNVEPYMLTVTANLHNVKIQPGDTFYVKNIFLNNFNVGTGQNDIALLELTVALKYSIGIRPICLASESRVTGKTVIVAGWGRTQNGGYSSDVPRQATITVMNPLLCRNQMTRVLFPEMICAKDPNNRMDSCQGDSGGPLMIKCGNIYIQAGIISWGSTVCASGNPGLYTDVSFYRSWIITTMRNDHPCFQRPC